MQKEKYLKLPLEERLRRMAEGKPSSPQFSRRLIDRFCETPIIPALESAKAFTETEKLRELLREQGLKNTELVTFGDVALNIIDLYLHSSYPETEVPLIRQLTVVFFYCFDFVLNIITTYAVTDNSEKFRRTDLAPPLRSIYDLINLSFDDLDDYNLFCSHGIPPKCMENRSSFCREKNFSYSSAKLIRVYEKVRMGEKSREELIDWDELADLNCFDLPDSVLPSNEMCRYLIDFFVCPVALIMANLYEKQEEQTNTEA